MELQEKIESLVLTIDRYKDSDFALTQWSNFGVVDTKKICTSIFDKELSREVFNLYREIKNKSDKEDFIEFFIKYFVKLNKKINDEEKQKIIESLAVAVFAGISFTEINKFLLKRNDLLKDFYFKININKERESIYLPNGHVLRKSFRKIEDNSINAYEIEQNCIAYKFLFMNSIFKSKTLLRKIKIESIEELIINKSKKSTRNEQEFKNVCLFGLEETNRHRGSLEFKISSKLKMLDVNQLRIDKENIKEIKEKSIDIEDIMLIELPHNRFYDMDHDEMIFRFFEIIKRTNKQVFLLTPNNKDNLNSKIISDKKSQLYYLSFLMLRSRLSELPIDLLAKFLKLILNSKTTFLFEKFLMKINKHINLESRYKSDSIKYVNYYDLFKNLPEEHLKDVQKFLKENPNSLDENKTFTKDAYELFELNMYF
jgi:hypothetical protein